MNEAESSGSAAPSSRHGQKRRLAAVIGGLVAAITTLAVIVEKAEQIVGGAHRICREFGGCTAQEPPATAQPGPAPARRQVKGPGHGTFVLVGADGATAPLAARLRRTLELEGIELATGPTGAAQLVELAATAASPAQMAPEGGPRLFGVVVTLEARVRSRDEGAPAIAVVQRQARGFGETPEEAREKAALNAAELLGRRLAEALQ